MRGKVVGKLEQEIEKTREAIQDMSQRAVNYYYYYYIYFAANGDLKIHIQNNEG